MEIQKSGFGSTTWRITESDATEQFTLGYNAGSMTHVGN
jgi:hypothetical protein